MCCDSWCCKELDTSEHLTCTELRTMGQMFPVKNLSPYQNLCRQPNVWFPCLYTSFNNLRKQMYFPGGTEYENLPANAEDTGSIHGP